MKKILAILMAALMLALCIPAGAFEVEDVDPVGMSLAGINAPYITAGGNPSTTQFVTDETFAAHTLTIINAWDSQCGPCRSEMPDFQRLYDEFGDDGAVLIVGSCDTMIGGTMLSDYNYLQQMGYTYPNVIPDSILHNLVWLNGFLPQTFIVDSNGTVIDFIAGSTNYQTLMNKIGQWMAYYSDDYYDVSFVDGLTGEVFATQNVHAGYRPEYPEAPEHVGYTFAGWDPANPPVIMGPTTITAKYNIRTYRVRFYDSITGEKIVSKYVQYGNPVEPPEPPVHEGYNFIGWDHDLSFVSEAMDVYTIYQAASAGSGDVDGNGTIESLDALHVLRYAFSLEELTPAQLAEADVNGDGSVNSVDALAILRMALGM